MYKLNMRKYDLDALAALKIEVARIHKLDGAGETKAFVDISVADAFVIKGLRIVQGTQGLFVAMPREYGKDGKWHNTVIPLRRDVKDQIEKVVMEMYEDLPGEDIKSF